MIVLLCALVFANDPLDIREDIGDGAMVNWTTLTLEVSNSGQGRGVGATRKVVEAGARSGLGEQVRYAVGGVRVTAEVDVNDLLRDETFGETIHSRAGRWAVGEARYYASGRIEVVAELPLLDLLKPYSLSTVQPKPDTFRQPNISGILIDARDTDATPMWSPRVMTESDQVLWDGTLWSDIAVTEGPVIWVSDPAHPAATRVGSNPLIVQAQSSSGDDIVLTHEDGVRFRTTLQGSEIVRNGVMVIVVDPTGSP